MSRLPVTLKVHRIPPSSPPTTQSSRLFLYSMAIQLPKNSFSLTLPLAKRAPYLRYSSPAVLQHRLYTALPPPKWSLSTLTAWQYHSPATPLHPPFPLSVPPTFFLNPRSQQSLGRGQRPAVRRPGSGRGSSCPSSCSRWGRGQPGRLRHRWCRASSPARSWGGRSPWTWSGWTTAPGSAAWGWAAQGVATVGNTLSLFFVFFLNKGRWQKLSMQLL